MLRITRGCGDHSPHTRPTGEVTREGGRRRAGGCRPLGSGGGEVGWDGAWEGCRERRIWKASTPYGFRLRRRCLTFTKRVEELIKSAPVLGVVSSPSLMAGFVSANEKRNRIIAAMSLAACVIAPLNRTRMWRLSIAVLETATPISEAKGSTDDLSKSDRPACPSDPAHLKYRVPHAQESLLCLGQSA